MGRVCYPNECYHDDSENGRSPQPILGQLAIDIAVSNNQVACLQAILYNLMSREQVSVGSRYSQPTSLVPAAYLCRIDNPKGLELLLGTGFSNDDLKV